MTRARHIWAAAAGATALTAGLLALPPSASAAAVPNGTCGSGYSRVATYDMRNDLTTTTPHVGGHVYVYYSAASGKNCAIARPIAAWVGKNTYVSVCISLGDKYSSRQSCDGYGQRYRFFAGPVYVSARHQCISIEGYLVSPTAASWPYDVLASHILCG